MKKEDKYRVLYGDLLGYEYIYGACITYENSITHFKYGEIAAKEKDFGIAIAHLILGAEELIKALILICLHRDPHFIDDAEKEKLFTNHSFKHLNIKELFKACSELGIYEYENDSFYSLLNSSQENKFQSTGHFLNKILGIFPINEDQLEDLFMLMDNSNQYKNRGFYVDFRFNWIVPEDIDDKDYSKYRVLVQKLNNYIQPIFTMPLTDERIINFIYNE